MTLAELKAALDKLTPEQLARPAWWSGDEIGGEVYDLCTLPTGTVFLDVERPDTPKAALDTTHCEACGKVASHAVAEAESWRFDSEDASWTCGECSEAMANGEKP